MSKSKYNLGVLFAIFALAQCGAYHMLAATALGGMKKDAIFSQYGDTTIQMITSLPSLLVIPGALLLPLMARYLSHKKLAIIGTIIMLVTGPMPAFMTDMTWILIGRGVGGFCMGYLLPIATSMIMTDYEGDARKNVTAWYNMAGPLITGVALNFLNGFLATIGWQYVYASYLIYAIVLLVIIFVMPDRGVVRASTTGGPTIVVTKFVILFGFMSMFNQLMVRTMTNNLSMMVVTEGSGNSAAVGSAMSFMTLGSVFMGFFFATVAKRLKGNTKSLGTLILAAGFFVIFMNYQSDLLIIVGGFLVGVGTMLNASSFMLSLGSAVPATALTGAMVAYNIFFNAGQFVAPYVTNNLSLLIDNTVRARFLETAIMGVVLAVIYVFLARFDKKAYEDKASDTAEQKVEAKT